MRSAALLLVVVQLAGCGPAADDAGEARSGSSAATVPGSSPEGADGLSGAAAADTAPGRTASGEESARVLFLGTSLTAGLGLLRESDRYTARLQEMADSAGLSATMVNAGTSGETSAAGLRRLDWLLEQHDVDVLVVELGANDGLRGHDPDALEANLREIVRRVRQRHPGVAVVLVGMEAPPNLGERYVRRFRSVFPEVAEDVDAALVPFLLEGVAGEPELNQEDGIHPTAAGHRRIARNVWPVLERTLRSHRSRTGGAP